jgi:hypothetical protein
MNYTELTVFQDYRVWLIDLNHPNKAFLTLSSDPETYLGKREEVKMFEGLGNTSCDFLYIQLHK